MNDREPESRFHYPADYTELTAEARWAHEVYKCWRRLEIGVSEIPNYRLSTTWNFETGRTKKHLIDFLNVLKWPWFNKMRFIYPLVIECPLARGALLSNEETQDFRDLLFLRCWDPQIDAIEDLDSVELKNAHPEGGRVMDLEETFGTWPIRWMKRQVIRDSKKGSWRSGED